MRKLYLFSSLILSASAFSSSINHDETVYIEFDQKEVHNRVNDSRSWDKEKQNRIFTNSGFQIKFSEHTIKANAIARYTSGPLLETNKNLLFYTNTPQTYVARDLFKLQHRKENKTELEEATLNRFEYEWGDHEVRFKAGRMFIRYGSGKIINPVNPVNHPAGLHTTHTTTQGNDGLGIKLQKDPNMILNIYLLGDKSLDNYKEEISRTLILHGTWKINTQTKLEYTFGEDQKRHKYGFEISHTLKDIHTYAQVMRNSQNLDDEEPDQKGLAHYVVGAEYTYDKIEIDLEFGKYDSRNTYIADDTNQTLPLKSYSAFKLQWNFDHFHNISASIVNDADQNFSILSTVYDNRFRKHFGFKLYAQGPSQNYEEEDDSRSVKLIPSTAGITLYSIL